MSCSYQYGNYTGPNWTGGQCVTDPGATEDYKILPKSPTDNLARTHDWAYSNAKKVREGNLPNKHDIADAIIDAADRALRDGAAARFRDIENGIGLLSHPGRS